MHLFSLHFVLSVSSLLHLANAGEEADAPPAIATEMTGRAVEMDERCKHQLNTFVDRYANFKDRQQHFIDIVCYDEDNLLKSFAKYTDKAMLATYGGPAMAYAIILEKHKDEQILRNANVQPDYDDIEGMATTLLEYVSKRREHWKPLLRQVLACKQFDLFAAIINGIQENHGASMRDDVRKVTLEYVKKSCQTGDNCELLLLSLVKNNQLDLLLFIAQKKKKEVATHGVPALIRATELQTRTSQKFDFVEKPRAEAILIEAGVLDTMSTTESERHQLFSSMVTHNKNGLLLTIAKHLTSEVTSHGGLALLQSINEEKLEASSILYTAGATVQPFEITQALAYIRDNVGTKAKWQNLLQGLVMNQQIYLIGVLAEHMNSLVMAYGAAAHNLAEELGHNSVYMTLSIARLDRQHGDSKLLDFAQEMIAREELEWDDFLCQITNFGKTGLLSMIAETMTTKVIAHGSLALFHAICKDNNEARNTLLNAGAHLKNDEKKLTKKQLEFLSKHATKDVVLRYIAVDVITANQWREFLVKIAVLRRADILRIIAKRKNSEMGAFGGLALLHTVHTMDYESECILLKAGAHIPKGDDPKPVLDYIKKNVNEQAHWENILSRVVILRQVGIFELIEKHRKDQICEYGGIALFKAMYMHDKEVIDSLIKAGIRIQSTQHITILNYISRHENTEIRWKHFLENLVSYKQQALLTAIEDSMQHKITSYGGLALFVACKSGDQAALKGLIIAKANIHSEDHDYILRQLKDSVMTDLMWRLFLAFLVCASQSDLVGAIADKHKMEVARHGVTALAMAMKPKRDKGPAMCAILEKAGVSKALASSVRKQNTYLLS